MGWERVRYPSQVTPRLTPAARISFGAQCQGPEGGPRGVPPARTGAASDQRGQRRRRDGHRGRRCRWRQQGRHPASCRCRGGREPVGRQAVQSTAPGQHVRARGCNRGSPCGQSQCRLFRLESGIVRAGSIQAGQSAAAPYDSDFGLDSELTKTTLT